MEGRDIFVFASLAGTERGYVNYVDAKDNPERRE